MSDCFSAANSFSVGTRGLAADSEFYVFVRSFNPFFSFFPV